ncbi:MAG: DUF2971 domain-containing protein [Paracoccaceae bacterium]
MTFDKTWSNFISLLYSELSLESEFFSNAPLLAHYTSLANLEKILSQDEVWLSNPLFMNDLEEVRFGVNNGVDLVHRNQDLRASLGADTRRAAFYDAVNRAYDEYATEHVLDLYIMCFSAHKHGDTDGRLSMWRGYGANGNGAALVLDVSTMRVIDESPLVFSQVHYASPEARRASIEAKISEVATFMLQNDMPDEFVSRCAHVLFQRICLFAIFSKHHGFLEEEEWRLVYLKDRDKERKIEPYLSYFNGPNGIEPKLKLKAKPIEGVIGADFLFSDIIHSLIIGPSASSPLTKMTVERMLRTMGKERLIKKLNMSSIPFRSD